MTQLLHLDVSPRGRDESVSRRLSQAYLDGWLARRPDDTVATRDLSVEQPPFVSAAWIQGAFGPPDEHADEHRLALRHSDELIRELEAADVIVIGTPMYNFNIPAQFKAWIDQVVRAGRTFAYAADGPHGLLLGKQAAILRATAGDYNDPANAVLDHQAPYLRFILGFIGIHDVELISVAARDPEGAEDGLAEAQDTIARTVERQIAALRDPVAA